MGSNGVPLQRLVNLDQLDVNLLEINHIFCHLISKQYTNSILKLILLFLKTLPYKCYFSGMMC